MTLWRQGVFEILSTTCLEVLDFFQKKMVKFVTASEVRLMRTMRTQGTRVPDIVKAFPQYNPTTVYRALKRDSREVLVERKVLGAVRRLRKSQPHKRKPFGRVKIARASNLSKKVVQRALKRCKNIPGQKRTLLYGCSSIFKRRAKMCIEILSQPIEKKANQTTPGGRGGTSQGWA